MNEKAAAALLLLMTGALALMPITAGAHCDTTDGPVVIAAKAAVQ